MEKSLGFPKMYKEVNEKRAFLPAFFGDLKQLKTEIWLEQGYGSGMGFTDEDYLKENDLIKFATNKEVYSKDIVIVLRAPSDLEFGYMKKGAILISMLHYITRESRNIFMEKLGIITFSMDSMVDDDDVRVVVNHYGTAFNGAKAALEQLESDLAGKSLGRPLNIAIIGMGDVGLAVAKAFKSLSNARFDITTPHQGIKITMLTRSITSNLNYLSEELKMTDILVDASSRADTSKCIVSNHLLSLLPEHAVILDITADPYNFDSLPYQIKAIEGIPTGHLDQILFKTDDESYQDISNYIATDVRRNVISCNAWPGVEPHESKKMYGKQLLPLIKVLINKGYENLDPRSEDHYERILCRSMYV